VQKKKHPKKEAKHLCKTKNLKKFKKFKKENSGGGWSAVFY
jgi:hypothetical protein